MSPPLWAAFVVLGTLAAGVSAALRLIGAPPTPANVLLTGLSAITALAVVAAAWKYRPDGALGWYLLGAGQLAYTIGELARTEHAGPAFPGTADVFSLMQYPLVIGALVSFVRRRAPGRQAPALFDAGILAIGAGLLSWVYLIGPLTADQGMSPSARLVAVAYPVGDLLVLAIGLRMLLGGGARVLSYRLLLGSLLTMLGADTARTQLGSSGTAWSCALWLTTYALLGGAALHPSMRRIGDPAPVRATRTTTGRLVALAGAALLAPAVLLIRYVQGVVTDIPVIAVACTLLFLLVLGRMAGLVAAQRRIAVTDSLTGLHTRGAFEEQLRFPPARGRDRGFGVVLLDVDHFKRINDAFGHPAGDRVLREVARRLRAATRSTDLVARYGGEEFALLVPDAGEAQLAGLADRVRRAMAGGEFDLGDDVRRQVTVSIGTAVFPADATDPDELIQVADRALYAAKRAGRNRVVAAGGRPDQPEQEEWPEPVRLARRHRTEFEAA